MSGAARPATQAVERSELTLFLLFIITLLPHPSSSSSLFFFFFFFIFFLRADYSAGVGESGPFCARLVLGVSDWPQVGHGESHRRGRHQFHRKAARSLRPRWLEGKTRNQEEEEEEEEEEENDEEEEENEEQKQKTARYYR